jgi:hypothetical protein
MDFLNLTPFPNLRFLGEHSSGTQFGTLLVKGTFCIGENGMLDVADEQARILQTDVLYGDLNASSLRYPSDIVPFKPGCDIVVNAIARAPKGHPMTTWSCGIACESNPAIRKELTVTGPRQWEPLWRDRNGLHVGRPENSANPLFMGWRLSEPQAVESVPIRYELAFGGVLEKPPASDETQAILEAYEYNPIGQGLFNQDYTLAIHPQPAPQIVAPDTLLTSPFSALKVEGFGAMPPAWLPRRAKGGTFDENWKETVWPRWPDDYDFSFHNSAHPDLILSEYLGGDEHFTLWGFDGSETTQKISLPALALNARLSSDDGTISNSAMNLDTVVFDLADDDPADHRVFISWRVNFDHEQISGISIFGQPLSSGTSYTDDFVEQAGA